MKKKILFRIGTLQSGGAERMLVDIINNLDTNLYQITLLLNVNSGIFLKELNKEIVLKHLYNEVEWPLISNYLPVFSKIIRTIKHNFYYSLPFLIQKFILKNKSFDTSVCFIQDLADSVYKIKSKNKIIWLHAIMSEMIKKDDSLKNQLPFFKHYNKIIAISEEVKQDFNFNFKGFEEKVSVLLNPLNKDKIIENANLFYPNEFKKSLNKLKIVSIGRIIPSKGFHRLIELKQKLDAEKIDADFFIIGQVEDKHFFNSLKKKFKDSSTNIHFLGTKENPYPYIKNADIMIHPSIHEGYGLVLAESLILKTPVIATNIPVFKEFANNEIFYVANNDSEFSVEAIEAIKKIQLGQTKGNLSNTNILDIKEYVNQLNHLF